MIHSPPFSPAVQNGCWVVEGTGRRLPSFHIRREALGAQTLVWKRTAQNQNANSYEEAMPMAA